MKTLGATFLLTVYLLASTEAGQLLKLPAIYHHFTEHRKTEPATGFFSFLAMHYWNDHAHHGKHSSKHQHLPFKNGRHLPVMTTAAPAFLPSKIAATPEPVIVINPPSCHTDLHAGTIRDIFQPPRLS
jgi:hypothetical protein